jgi:hypothetical protein
MKTFKEYLAESKKVYSFKVKVAGELPEKFQENLKARLERCKVLTFEKVTTTPIQEAPLDFPELSNMEVTVFEVVTEYPITSPELSKEVKETGIAESCFRVRGSNEPSEQEQVLATAEPSGEALLDDANYKEGGKIKHKDYFGDDFNKGFLKDLEKTAKARKKEDGQGEYKLPKAKQDKEGAKSAIGSK